MAWVLVAVGLGWWVLRVTALAGDERANASGYGQFVLAAVGLLIVVGDGVLKSLSPAAEPGVDESAEQLASAMRVQWQQAAAERGLLQSSPLPIRWRRSRQPVAGPPSAATARHSAGTSFAPLPGLGQVTAPRLRSGTHRALHGVYGGLPSGRLIITGGPGSGKSSAAVLLLLEALHHRDQTPVEERAQVPVPVLFTLHGWDPETTPVRDWLITKLVELPTLAGRDGPRRAAELLASGRVAVLLDGLDEIPRERRAAALRALGTQATFRLVLLTRTAELVDAAGEDILTGAVALELAPLTSRDAARYLRHNLPDPVPEPWRAVLEALDRGTDAPVVHALDNPLLVTLLRAAYGPSGDSVGELLDEDRFPTRVEVTDHLLDLAVTTAYSPRPGMPAARYDVDTARHTLTVVARMLQALGTRDFAWWDLPRLIPRTRRVLFSGAANGVVGGLVGVLVGGLIGPFTSGLAQGVLVGAFSGMVAGTLGGTFYARLDRDWPVRIGTFTWAHARWAWNLRGSLFVGAPLGALAGLRLGVPGGVLIGLGATLVLGVATGVMRAMRSVDPSKAARPQDTWRGDLLHWLVQGLVITVVATAGIGIGLGFANAAIPMAAMGTLLGLTASRAWVTGVCQVLVAAWAGVPWRLGRFLEDAHRRGVLRVVGPVYQFRHATLHDRLAGTTADGAEET
ncbi:NACHT domain-containing protein [Saccharothrix variisporea]|uniref:hypothetical protein n=1 Tax=Saccharothrix variisporea TaxID=543527 RepID=UPI000EAF3F98|nr:hypothetical protein [Saccharothrix variisporea]